MSIAKPPSAPISERTPISERKLESQRTEKLPKENLPKAKLDKLEDKLDKLATQARKLDKLATQARKSAINYLQKYSQASSTVETELIPITPANRDACDLNKTHIFRFRQEYKSIPIYDSLINVEISKKDNSHNEYQIFVDSSKVDIYRDSFARVDSSPVIQEEDLKDKLENQVEYPLEGLTLNPKLYYYYDSYYYDRETQQKGKWLLAYITDLEISSPVKEPLEELVDYIIDAQTGHIVGELPRVRTFV